MSVNINLHEIAGQVKALPPELLTLTFAYLMSVSGFMVTPEMMA